MANCVCAEIRSAFCGMTKLGADDDILTHRLQSLAQQFFASSAAIAGRGIEEVASSIERFLDDVQCFLSVVDSPIRVCQLPRSESNFGDVHASIAKWTKFHSVPSH